VQSQTVEVVVWNQKKSFFQQTFRRIYSEMNELSDTIDNVADEEVKAKYALALSKLANENKHLK
jgi:hypothetical protein